MKQQIYKSSMGALARISMSVGVCASALLSLPAAAQKFPNLPITPEQRATAGRIAQDGVPLSDLVPDAPDVYVIKIGDSLWAISRLYLRSPWRWPELWGMNLDEIRNPHLIYPGQTLYLDKSNGRAHLSTTPPGPAASVDPESPDLPVVRLGPQVRTQASRLPIYALRNRDIEPFLASPMVLDTDELRSAPRIVAPSQEHMIISIGDRVYARGPEGQPLTEEQSRARPYRIFRNATPLRDPETGEVLGFEAEFLGKAALARGEGTAQVRSDGEMVTAQVPATIDIVSVANDIQVGDRLAPEAEREYLNFIPRPPAGPVNGRVVSIYGSNSVANASQNQIIAINRGKRDAMEPGMVLAILSDGRAMLDRTEQKPTLLKLPNERNGLLMVFKVFERVSYGLILDISDPVRVGDRLVSPQ